MKTSLIGLLVSIVFLAGANVAVGLDLLLAGFSADAVFRIDRTTGAVVGPSPFASHPTMDGPAAMVYNPAGDLLVLNEFSGNVLRFNGTTGAFVSTFITPAALSGSGVIDPDDMELGSDGNLYISGHFNVSGNIFKFDGTTGAFLGSFSFFGPTEHTHGLAMGNDGNWYNGYVDSRRIDRFDGATGAHLGTFGSEPTLFPIADIAFGPTRMYVTLDGGGGVARFDSVSGAFIDYLIPAGAFTSYWGALVDGPDLFLANTDGAIIKRYNAATGAFISDFVIGAPGVFDIISMPTVVPEPACLIPTLLVIGCLSSLRRRMRIRREY